MNYHEVVTRFMTGDYYRSLGEQEKQVSLERFKDNYLEKNPDSDRAVIDSVTERYNKEYLRSKGMGRAIPTLDRVSLPTQDQDTWNNLSQSQKREKIEEFEAKIPEMANKYPTMKEDAQYFFEKYAQSLTRENETQDQSRVADHFNRALFHGFAGGLLNYVGLSDASEAVKNTFHTRPDLDDSWSGAFAQGAGDLGASMTVFIGAMAATRGMGGSAALAANVATGASLGTNAIMRYNEAYRNALDAGLSQDDAAESGMSAVPAAAIDVIGDRILGLKLLPNNASRVFATGTNAQKRAALQSMFKDNMTRPKLMEVARAAFAEGVTEVSGDYYASRAPYLLHEENKDYLPTDKDLFKSFVIGSVLGGTMAGGAMATRYTGDKSGMTGQEYANKDLRDIGEVERNFDSIQNNQDVWKAMTEGRWSEAYNITKTVVEDNIKREQAEVERIKAEREMKLAESGTTLDPEININFPNEATGDSDTLQQQGSLTQTFEFTPLDNDPVRNQVYTDLFESNMDATGNLQFDQKTRAARTQRLNQIAPQRVRFQQELESTTKQSNLQQNQTPSILAYTDTLAAKWLSQNPDRNIDDFYGKINIKSVDSRRGFNAVIDAYKQQGKAVIGVTPKDNFANFMGEMLTSFRKADLLQDILAPSEIQQLKDSLGVAEFDNNSDKELSKQFINWLDNTYTGPDMTGAFTKIKEWVADIYKSVQMWLPRNIGMDSVFESLFQVTLSPREFNNRIGQQFSVTQAENNTSKATLDQLRNKQPNKLAPQQTQAPEQAAAKGRAQRSRERFNKVANVTPVETTTPVEVNDVTPDAQQTPREFLKGRAWALQVIADLEVNAHNVRVQVVPGINNFEGKYLNGVIYLDMDSIREGSELERIFKHEAAHALTIGYLNSLTQNLQGDALVKRLNELQKDPSVTKEAQSLIKAYFHAAKKLNIKVGQRFSPGEKNLTRTDYAFTNLDEFLAEAFSNPDFQEKLANIQYNGKSVFDHILDLFKSLASWAEGYTTAELFGKYDGQNVLAEVMLAAHQMIGEQAGPFNPPFSPKFSPKLGPSVNTARKLLEELRSKVRENSMMDLLYFNLPLNVFSNDLSIIERNPPVNANQESLAFDRINEIFEVTKRLTDQIDKGWTNEFKSELIIKKAKDSDDVYFLTDDGNKLSMEFNFGTVNFSDGSSLFSNSILTGPFKKKGKLFINNKEYSVENFDERLKSGDLVINQDNIVPFSYPDNAGPKFSPKDLLKATDEKNPASVMQKFVDVFQSKIKQTDRTLDDANKIAELFLLDVYNNVTSKQSGEVAESIKNDFIDFATFNFGEQKNVAASIIDNAFSQSSNYSEYLNIVESKLGKQANLEQNYINAKNEIRAINQTFIKVPNVNTLSLDTYLNVTYINQEGNRVRELYDPNNSLHALHATDLTKEIYSMDSIGRSELLDRKAKEISKERYKTIEGLIDYLSGNNDYTQIERAIVLAAALKYSYTTNGDVVTLVEMTESNELLPAITGGDSASLAQAIKEESSLKKAFKKAIENNIKFQKEQNSSKDGWIRHTQSDDMGDAINLMNDCAGTPWCTGRAESTANSQLRSGNFDVYFVNGKPQVAIRTEGGRIKEVRGTLSDQSLTPEQEQWAKQRIETADYTGGEDFLADMQLRQDLIDIIQNKDVGKLIETALSEGKDPQSWKPVKKFNGAIGYGRSNEFEQSIYDALSAVTIDTNFYQSDTVYYQKKASQIISDTKDLNINKKYVYIEGDFYHDGSININSDVLFVKDLSGFNVSIKSKTISHLDVRAGKLNVEAEKATGYISLISVEDKSVASIDFIGSLYERENIYLSKVNLRSNTIFAHDITGTSLINHVDTIETINIYANKDIRRINVSAVSSVDAHSIIESSVKSNSINVKNAIDNSIVDANQIAGNDQIIFSNSSVKTNTVSARHIDGLETDSVKITPGWRDALSAVMLSNVKIKNAEIGGNNLHLQTNVNIERMVFKSDTSWQNHVVLVNPENIKVGTMKSDLKINLRHGLNEDTSTFPESIGTVIDTEEGYGSNRPDNNGGFLSPKLPREKAFRKERLAEIVEALPPTSILTEMDIATFDSIAGESTVSDRAYRELKLNIKFSDVPVLNMIGGKIISSENALIAATLLDKGYDKVPVIVNSDINWSDQRNPSSENYVEEWPAFITKQNGEQVVNPFNRSQLNLEQHYPRIPQEDVVAYDKAYQEGNESVARELLIKTAKTKGFDTTLYYRADVDPVTEVTRPLYLVPDESVAKTMAEFYAKSREGDLDSFVYPYFVRSGLNFANEFDKISGRILNTSSYIFGEYHSRGTQNFTAFDLKVNGYDGVIGTIDGTASPEIVLLNPQDGKSAATFEHVNGKLVPLNKRFSDAADVRYSPKAAFFKDNASALQKFKMIRQGRLSDQKDSQTTAIKQAMRKIKDADLMKLTEEELTAFFNIVNNVYNSRMKGIKSPMNRADSDKIIEQLAVFNEMLNDMAVEEMINDFSGILDFSTLDLDTITREELQKFINENQTEEQILAAVNKSDARKKAQQKIFDRYRAKYEQAVEEIRERYANAQEYVTQMEQVHDTPIVEEKIRLAVMLHFDYLTGADVSTMNGNELYNHFFAVNNLLDGSIAYVGETTIKNLAATQDTMENLATYISTFRDPHWKRYGKFLEAIDRLNEKAELKQVRLDRVTAVEKTREFLLNDVFGGLVQGIHSNAASRKKFKMDQYRNLILSLKKKTGRYMNAEDRFMIAAFARLLQHKYSEAGDIALVRNIAKENESIQNIIDKQQSESNAFENTFGPLFRKAVEGLEGDGSYDKLMKELTQRLSGTEGIKTGEARAEFIQGMIDMFSDFSLENKIISEGFHGVPFTPYANYSPNPVQISKFESRDSQAPLGEVLTDVLDNMEHHHNKEGIKTKSGHFFEREKSLGKDKHYSYNPDFVVDRQLDNFTVDSATIFDRFLIAERLKKGSALSEVIGREEDGSYHADRVNHLLNLAIEFVSHATSRSEPKNMLVNILRKFVNAYSRVTLSSIHHLISQPLAGMMDYAVRNGDISGWFKAASYYAQNRDAVEKWLNDNAASFGQRGVLESMGLDYTKLPQPELNIKSDAIIKKLEIIYDGAGDVISTAIREGDKFGSRAVVLAHYLRMMQEKNPTIKSLNDVDWVNVDKRAFISAMMKAEKNINASNKINRGDFFTDRSPSYAVLRNVFMAFAAHPASLATQMNMAWRDLIDLKSQGATREDVAPKIRTIAAITTQTVSFAISRFYIGSLITKAMVAMLQDLFDDEEGKLAELEEKLRLARLQGDHTLITAAEEELQLAKDARSVLLKMENQYKAGQGGLRQSIIRDMAGSLYFGFNSPTVLRMEPITTFYDKIGEKWHREAREERIKDYDAQIARARDEEKYHLVNSLKEQKFNFMQYQNIPLMYDVVGGLEIGGSYGGALNVVQKGTGDFMDSQLGVKEWNWNDWIIYAAVTGMGQSELRKILTNMDRIENSQFKTMESYEERKDAAVISQEEKENSEYERFMKRMMR